MLTYDQVTRKVEALRQAARDRDQRMKDVHDVRSGDIDTVIPGAMPDPWPRPITANSIDTSARDLAEVMGQMPAINCTNSLQTSDRSRKFSSKRTKVANHYVIQSNLTRGKQVEFCDHFNTYGMAIYSVEPDFDNKCPILRVENPMGVYPELDLFGRLRSYTKVWREEALHLVAKYPHLMKIMKTSQSSNPYGGEDPNAWAQREIEVVKYIDDDMIYMYLPSLGNRLVDQMPNPMGRMTIAIACRPSYDREIRGAFDDAIWVYLAKSRMAMLGLEATEKAVRAPLAVPRDVQKMTFGADAVIRTDNPEKIKYVGVDMPQFAAQEMQILEREERVATRSPAVRTGELDASIITGKGVQALQGGFDSVVTTAQSIIAEAMRVALQYAFDMDEKLWPNEKKTIRGVIQGAPFEETYVPSKDIAGNHTVDVTYGFAAGQDPARAIVALLQLRGDQLVSRDFVQRQLPMEIDVVQMQTQIDNEQFEDAMKAGVQQMMQMVGQLTMQGQDPVDLLTKLAKVISLREGGKPVHEAVLSAFTPPKVQNALQAPQQGAPGTPGQPGPGGPPTGPAGVSAPPGQQPDMMQLLASLKSGGGADMTNRMKRTVAV